MVGFHMLPSYNIKLKSYLNQKNHMTAAKDNHSQAAQVFISSNSVCDLALTGQCYDSYCYVSLKDKHTVCDTSPKLPAITILINKQ